jgi:UDP-N-acetylmuramyl pentapeptide phosphotransferase/UDP-N-acetylglucosamine-1-phosphate transferase
MVNMMWNGLIVLAVSSAVTLAATKLLIPLLQRKGVMDVPNSRSSHSSPVPRGGGIGIIAGLAAGFGSAWVLGLDVASHDLLLAAGLVALVGVIDDRAGGLPVLVKLAVQVLAAGLIVFHSGGLSNLPLPAPLDIQLGVLAIPVALLWIVGVTNLYNFLDGIDGFAGLQGVIAGLGIAVVGEGTGVAAAGLALAGACSGFLLFNWHPARIFMGDVGSGTLGFILAALPFQLPQTVRSKVVFSVVIFLWFFLSDGIFTIVRRLGRGEKVWAAHCSHLYQRLVRAGMSHEQVVVRVGAGAVSLTLLGLIASRMGSDAARWVLVAVATGAFILYYRWTSNREGTPPGMNPSISSEPHHRAKPA